MSGMAVVTVAWLPLYAILGTLFVALYLKRRSQPAHLVFGLLCYALGTYAAGRAVVLSADEVSVAAIGQRIEWLGVLPAAAMLVHFVHLTTEHPGDGARKLAYAIAAVGWCACLAGLFFDPSRPVDTSRALVTLVTLDRGPEAATTVVGWVFIGAAALGLLYATSIAWIGSRGGQRHVRPLAIALTALCVAAVHDVLLNAGVLGSLFLFEHSAFVLLMTICLSLLREFVRIGGELEARTAELDRSVKELRAAQEELVSKEQLAAVGELAAVIAHEVRNPLAVIANAVAGLRRSPLSDADRATLLDILEEEGGRLNRLVGDLLSYARPIAVQHRRVPLRPCLGRAVELARETNPHSSKVEVKMALTGPEVVVGDEDLLRRAFTNLVENAFQAMHETGELVVSSSSLDVEGRVPGVALSFRDTGEGMDTLVRSKAGNPFFTTRPTGTGLGLAIVSRIVRAHGGNLSIESRHGEGTSITLHLPCEPLTDSSPPPAGRQVG
ncbi:MAG: hypothetical protein IT379_24420 [Deltaproteobacteria bacterium]|nr:hypothetical protein [Deltaproteobacteria bacterium]